MSETYLVTGAAGLAGNHVIRELVDRGLDPGDIIGLDLEPSPDALSDVAEEFTAVEADITDTAAVFEAFERHRPTRVIHLAALLIYDAREDPEPVIRVNCLGANTIFDAARVYGADRCVYASTGGVYGSAADYGDGTPVVGEDDPVKPSDAYSTSKYMNEVVARNFERRAPTEYVGVRIGGVWGRGRLSGSTGEFTSFLRDVALGRSRAVPEAWVDIFGLTGDIYASYGKDLGRWLVDLSNRDSLAYDLYNQRNETPFTLREAAELLEEHVPDVRVDQPSGDQPVEPPPVPDAKRWYDDLGFEQAWTFESALLDFVNYHREQAGLTTV